MSAGIKLNTREFTRTLAKYKAHTSRTNAEIINTKAFFIARAAVRMTKRVGRGKIAQELRRRIKVSEREVSQAVRFTKTKGVIRGKIKYKRGFAPLGALILNSRRGKSGQSGYFGSAMTAALDSLITARVRAGGFIASGWLPAVKYLEQFVPAKWRRGAAREDKRVKQYGSEKGAATAARQGEVVQAMIQNSAAATHATDKTGFESIGTEALQSAFDSEVSSMRKHIEDKLRELARGQGIKTN